MSVLTTTPDFLAWLDEHGFSRSDLDSPPVAWGLIALYEKQREPTDAEIYNTPPYVPDGRGENDRSL